MEGGSTFVIARAQAPSSYTIYALKQESGTFLAEPWKPHVLRGEWPSGPASSISLTEIKHGSLQSETGWGLGSGNYESRTPLHRIQAKIEKLWAHRIEVRVHLELRSEHT